MSHVIVLIFLLIISCSCSSSYFKNKFYPDSDSTSLASPFKLPNLSAIHYAKRSKQWPKQKAIVQCSPRDYHKLWFTTAPRRRCLFLKLQPYAHECDLCRMKCIWGWTIDGGYVKHCLNRTGVFRKNWPNLGKLKTRCSCSCILFFSILHWNE